MLRSFKPEVERKWLIMLSGIMWGGVGILLNWIASNWFGKFEKWQIIIALTAGPLLGLIISYFGFSNLASKNIIRILDYPGRVCLFAFQRWQMYFLIVFMMSLGIYMRSTDFIPKYLLAPVYIGIGTALFLSSFVYFKKFHQR